MRARLVYSPVCHGYQWHAVQLCLFEIDFRWNLIFLSYLPFWDFHPSKSLFILTVLYGYSILCSYDQFRLLVALKHQTCHRTLPWVSLFFLSICQFFLLLTRLTNIVFHFNIFLKSPCHAYSKIKEKFVDLCILDHGISILDQDWNFIVGDFTARAHSLQEFTTFSITR